MTWLAYSHLGVAKRLTLDTQPGGALAGIPFVSQPVGRLLDGSGVLSRTTGTVVTVSKLSGVGTLSGTLTAVTVEGVFTFTDLKMDTVTGTVVLQFTAPGLVSVDSTSFNVTQPNTIIGCEVGSYAVTGTAQTLTRGPYMLRQDEVGSYAITGTAATLRFSGQYANEPVGLSTPWTITAAQPYSFDTLFPTAGSALNANGWVFASGDETTASIVSDAERGNVLQCKLPAGMAGGGAPFYAYAGGGGSKGLSKTGTAPFTVTKLFLGYYVKVASNWTDINQLTKHLYFFSRALTEDNNPSAGDFLITMTWQADPYTMASSYIQTSDTNGPWMHGLAHGRGVWQKHEWYFELNDIGVANGVMKCWVDGVLEMNYSNLKMVSVRKDFDWLKFGPIYGGGTSPVPYDLYCYFDDWYLKVGA